jgi:outer membrane protein TolC
MPDSATQGTASDKPLSLTEVATLAVQRNPDLVATRAKSDIAEAQAVAAGLLPDPQLSVSADHPTEPGTVNGYVLGLSEELQTLITRPTRQSAARATADQAKLNALWEEWQTAQKAQSLAVDKFFNDRKTRLLADSGKLLWTQSERSERALAAGNMALDTAGTDLAAALDLTSRQTAASRDALSSDISLKQLLNWQATTQVVLADIGDPPEITHDMVENALKTVTKTRPDLLALQAGYHAQDEAVRLAILQQFPAMTVGFNKSEDMEGIHSLGLGVTINLPIFGNAQAAVRIQEATRSQLRAEYQSRLNSTTTGAWKIWQETQLLRGQITLLEQKLPTFRQMAEVGTRAHERGDLAPATYVLLQTGLLTRESELLDFKAALWTDTIALNALLATGFSGAAGTPPH